MGCNTGSKGTKGAVKVSQKGGKGGMQGSGGKGGGKQSGKQNGPQLSFTKLEKQMGLLVELFKSKMGKESDGAKGKVRWDCTLCQMAGNFASRDTCRGCQAPKQPEPLVIPPGLGGRTAATGGQSPPVLDQAMEVDTKVQAAGEGDTKPILAAKIKECEQLLKDMGEAEPGTKRAAIVDDIKEELAGLKNKLAQTQPIASQLAIATAAREKAALAVEAAAKAMEEAEAALREAKGKHQETVGKEVEAQTHLEAVTAKVSAASQASQSVSWAGVVQALQQQGSQLDPALKAMLAQALGIAELPAVGVPLFPSGGPQQGSGDPGAGSPGLGVNQTAPPATGGDGGPLSQEPLRERSRSPRQ